MSLGIDARSSKLGGSLRSASRLVVLSLILVACSSNSDSPSPGSDSGAASPVDAVSELVAYFEVPDFEGAARLAYPGQAALAALAEGASFAEVAEALRAGDSAVAANFWSGFAQGAGVFLTGDLVAEAGSEVVQNGVEFGVVEVDSVQVGERTILTRQSDGHRIDLLASFGAGLASPMIPVVETLLSANTEDSTLILSELRASIPSLLLASRQAWVPPAVSLDVVRLIELISRSG